MKAKKKEASRQRKNDSKRRQRAKVNKQKQAELEENRPVLPTPADLAAELEKNRLFTEQILAKHTAAAKQKILADNQKYRARPKEQKQHAGTERPSSAGDERDAWERVELAIREKEEKQIGREKRRKQREVDATDNAELAFAAEREKTNARKRVSDKKRATQLKEQKQLIGTKRPLLEGNARKAWNRVELAIKAREERVIIRKETDKQRQASKLAAPPRDFDAEKKNPNHKRNTDRKA